MGCGPSRLDGVESVARCRERRLLLQAVVGSRRALANAHAAYAAALKNAGAALSDYAAGEVVAKDDDDGAGGGGGGKSSSFVAPSSVHFPTPPVETVLPPPPLPDDIAPAPIARSSSAPDIVIPKKPTKQPSGEVEVIEEEDEFADAETEEERPQLVRKGKKSSTGAAAATAAAAAVATTSVAEDTPQPPPRTARRMKDGKKAKAVILAAPLAPSLLQILKLLDDRFLEASGSAHDVLMMLEAARMHYHSNFAETRGFVDHSARVMQAITWNHSFKSSNGERVLDNEDNDPWETLATVLDKLLAWEKKLCEEVKESELMKMEYQRKLKLLNKRKNSGVNRESLEKTKAVVSHLHSKYVVDMQSMESTITEINRLRDHQLYPKLLDLVAGLWKMWEAMYDSHRNQFNIMREFRSFDISVAINETTEDHHRRTIQLRDIIDEWHLQFDQLVTHQKEYIGGLHSWLKLNLLPIETDPSGRELSPQQESDPPIRKLLNAWHEDLQKLPSDPAKMAIFRFKEVVGIVVEEQQEELRLKQLCVDTSKELEKKRRHFEDWSRRYMERIAGRPEGANPEGDPIAERKHEVDTLEAKLKEERLSYQKKCKLVREKSLGSFRTLLPELFRSVSDFALSSSMMYRDLWSVGRMSEHAGDE